MNDADKERFRKERRHLQPPGAWHHFTCWCGLCHCDACAEARQKMHHEEKKKGHHA